MPRLSNHFFYKPLNRIGRCILDLIACMSTRRRSESRRCSDTSTTVAMIRTVVIEFTRTYSFAGSSPMKTKIHENKENKMGY